MTVSFGLLWHENVREFILLCKCCTKKRSRSQHVTMLPGRAIDPWEALKIYLISVGTESLTGHRYPLLEVYKASRFLFAHYPLSSKQEEGVANRPMKLCLTLGVPQAIHRDEGGGFEARCTQHLCR